MHATDSILSCHILLLHVDLFTPFGHGDRTPFILVITFLFTKFRFQSVRPARNRTEPRTEPEPRHVTRSVSRFLGHPFFGSRFLRFRFGSVRFQNRAHPYPSVKKLRAKLYLHTFSLIVRVPTYFSQISQSP